MSCLALHPNGRFAASGQAGAHPRVFVWDSERYSLISPKLFITSFCKSQFPHISINVSFIITNIKNKLEGRSLGAGRGPPKSLRLGLGAVRKPYTLISQKEFVKSFWKGLFPHKFVYLSFIIANIKNKLTILWGS